MEAVLFPFASLVDLPAVLGLVGALVGGLVTAVAAYTTARVAKETQVAVRELETTNPDAAISTLSLKSLGGYIYETLGDVPLAEYAAKPQVRSRVARAVDEIERFVTQDGPLAEGEHRPTAADESLALARAALSGGDTWQALARARRSLEIELRAIAEMNGVEIPARAGVGRLLRVLEIEQLIPPDLSSAIAGAIKVANQAIHGEDVSVDAAEDALFTTARALEFLHTQQRERRNLP